MSKDIPLICFDCNLPLSNWDKFLNKKYNTNLGYVLCSDCTEKREQKLIKKLSEDVANDLDFYDYKKYDPKHKDYSYKGRSIGFMLSGKNKGGNDDKDN